MVKFQPSKLAMRVRFPLPAPCLQWSVASFLITIMAAAPIRAAESAPCEPVVKKMRAAIAARPARLLLAVEDALAAGESCAGSIVAAAIEATRADERLLGDIVFTAVSAAPSMTAAIVEAAIGAAPASSATIKAAMEKALGDEAATRSAAAAVPAPDPEPQPIAVPASDSGQSAPPVGKESVVAGKASVPLGKAPVPEAIPPVEEPFVSDDFAFFSGLGVGGVYLVTPGAGTGIPRVPAKEITPRPPQKRRKVTVPGEPVSPVGLPK